MTNRRLDHESLPEWHLVPGGLDYVLVVREQISAKQFQMYNLAPAF